MQDGTVHLEHAYADEEEKNEIFDEKKKLRVPANVSIAYTRCELWRCNTYLFAHIGFRHGVL